MRKFYFATVGKYTEKTLRYGMMKSGCEGVVLFATEQTRDVAFRIKEDLTSNYGVPYFEIEIVEPNDFWGIVKVLVTKIVDITKTFGDVRIVVDLTGGTRTMSLASLTAVSLGKIKEIAEPYYYFYDEDENKIYEIELPKLILKQLSKSRINILRALRDAKKREKKIKSLAHLKKYLKSQKITITKGPISRHISYLKKLNFVIVEREGRECSVKISDDGLKYLRIIDELDRLNR